MLRMQHIFLHSGNATYHSSRSLSASEKHICGSCSSLQQAGSLSLPSDLSSQITALEELPSWHSCSTNAALQLHHEGALQLEQLQSAARLDAVTEDLQHPAPTQDFDTSSTRSSKIILLALTEAVGSCEQEAELKKDEEKLGRWKTERLNQLLDLLDLPRGKDEAATKVRLATCPLLSLHFINICSCIVCWEYARLFCVVAGYCNQVTCLPRAHIPHEHPAHLAPLQQHFCICFLYVQAEVSLTVTL